MFFQNQKDCRSPLEVLNGHFDRCVGFSQSTLDTLAASLAGIFCTPTGDGAGHPLLWDTYKGESLDGASSNTYIHTYKSLEDKIQDSQSPTILL